MPICLTGEPSALPSDPDPAICKGAMMWKIMVDRVDDGGRRRAGDDGFDPTIKSRPTSVWALLVIGVTERAIMG